MLHFTSPSFLVMKTQVNSNSHYHKQFLYVFPLGKKFFRKGIYGLRWIHISIKIKLTAVIDKLENLSGFSHTYEVQLVVGHAPQNHSAPRLVEALPSFAVVLNVDSQPTYAERNRESRGLHGRFLQAKPENGIYHSTHIPQAKVAQLFPTKREAGKYGVVEGPGEKGIRSVEWVASLCHSSLCWQPISASCFFPHSLHPILRETTQTLIQSLQATQVPEFPGDMQFFPS